MIRYNLNLKLFFLIKTLLIYFIICLKSYADTPKPISDLVVLGTDNAPVKIKIFSSLTCPHCANFHIKIVPEIKKNYVESGKVQLIFVDFPLDQAAFNASKLLHCLDQKKQIAFLDTIYENQDEWTVGSNINEINNNGRIQFKYQYEDNHTEFYSQDTWIWKSPLKVNIKSNIVLGIPGCDNKINYFVKKSGYHVTNPCRLIKTYHKHENDLHRTYTNETIKNGKVYKPPYYLPSCEI